MTSGERATRRARPARARSRRIDAAGSSCAALALLTGCIGVPIVPVAPVAPALPASSERLAIEPAAELAAGSAAGPAAGPAVKASDLAAMNGVIDGLAFGMNRTALDEAARAALRPLVTAMRRHPEVALELQGHTDNRGPAGDNLALSKRRVMAVVRFLVTEGVDPARLQPWGFGENRPLASNATPEGRVRNRRIEVRAIMPLQETGR